MLPAPLLSAHPGLGPGVLWVVASRLNLYADNMQPDPDLANRDGPLSLKTSDQ